METITKYIPVSKGKVNFEGLVEILNVKFIVVDKDHKIYLIRVRDELWGWDNCPYRMVCHERFRLEKARKINFDVCSKLKNIAECRPSADGPWYYSAETPQGDDNDKYYSIADCKIIFRNMLFQRASLLEDENENQVYLFYNKGCLIKGDPWGVVNEDSIEVFIGFRYNRSYFDFDYEVKKAAQSEIDAMDRETDGFWRDL